MNPHSTHPAIQLILVATFILLGTSFATAQRNEEPQPPSFELRSGLDSYLFVDQLGLELSLVRFYETYLDMDTYRIGPGDLLGFTLSGNISGTLRGVRVNSNGAIMLPHIGLIELDGLLFHEATTLVNERLALAFPGTESDMILESPRNLRVTITGNVPFPGPTVVMGQTRVDQAVFNAFFETSEAELSQQQNGMPRLPVPKRYPAEFLASNQYELRSITINRADGSQVSADLYRFLKTGDNDANPVVQDGDIIHVRQFHRHNPRISISGAVNQSLEMEYHPDDSLQRLLAMAGGTTFDASHNHVRISRITNEGLAEIVLDSPEEIDRFELLPNDRIIIPFDQDKRYTENVQVFGEARFTGRFAIEDGKTTLYELMKLTGGLTDSALATAAYLFRTQPGRTEFGTRSPINPPVLRRTSDQFVQGFEYLELEARLMQNRVDIDLTDSEAMKRIRLYDGDRLHIPKNEGTVFVFGQVNYPGYYNFEADKTSDAFIDSAGGFALSADTDRIFVIKAKTGSWHRPDDVSVEPGDMVFVDRVPFDELQAARMYDLQKRTQRNSNIQLIMTGLTTITSIITAYVAITR